MGNYLFYKYYFKSYIDFKINTVSKNRKFSENSDYCFRSSNDIKTHTQSKNTPNDN